MGFSASASFTASALLMPLGLYSAHIVRINRQRDDVPLALTPFFFGVQPFVEGLEWTGIDGGGSEPLNSLAGLGLLFFSYCFWMIWIPWSAWATSRSIDGHGLEHRLRWVAIVASVLGIAFYRSAGAVQPAGAATGGAQQRLRARDIGFRLHSLRTALCSVVRPPLLRNPWRPLIRSYDGSTCAHSPDVDSATRPLPADRSCPRASDLLAQSPLTQRQL